MRPKLFCFFAILVCCVRPSDGQVVDLSDFDSSEDILQNYLLEADECSSGRTLLFKIAETSRFKEKGEVVLRSTVGLWSVDAKKKISYSSNQLTTDGGTARISILFRLNGGEKGKIYPVSGDMPNGKATTLEPNPQTGGRADKKRAGVFGDSHTELDPLGLPLCNYMGIRDRYSNTDSMTKVWLGKWTMKSEVLEGNLRKSRWRTSDKSIDTELVFDRKSGNMPVLIRMFSVDASGKQTKDYSSETKTVWMHREDGKWIPKRVELSSSDFGRDRNATVDFAQLISQKHDELVAELDWKGIHGDERKDWFWTVWQPALEKLGRSGQEFVLE